MIQELCFGFALFQLGGECFPEESYFIVKVYDVQIGAVILRQYFLHYSCIDGGEGR